LSGEFVALGTGGVGQPGSRRRGRICSTAAASGSR
jgi:hypothetical protein